MSEKNPNIDNENKQNLENKKEENKDSKIDNNKKDNANTEKGQSQANNKEETQKLKNDATKNIEDEQPQEKEFVQREDEKVEEELENIKNIVQGEVNKILDDSQYDNWNDLVKDAREEKKQKKEAKKDDKTENLQMCQCCGEKEIDTSENPNSTYCKECRESMKSYPLNVKEILSVIIMIVLIFTSVWVLSQSMYTFKTVANARAYFKDGKLTSATQTFYDAESQFKVYGENISKTVLNYEAEVSYSLGLSQYEQLSSFMEQHYSDKDFTFFINPKMREIKKSVDEYNYIKDIVMSCFNEQSSYKDVIKQIDKKIKDDKEHKFDKGMIDFWKYNLAIQYQQDDKTIFDWVLKMKKDSPQYASTYLPIMGEYYLRTKEYEKVFSISDKMLELNSQDTKAYRDKSIAYRMKKDTKNSLKVCKKGLDISYTDADLNHQMSILKLLSKEKQEALSYAKLAFENSPNDYRYVENANLYAACLKINGDEDTYKQLDKEVKNSGITLSEEISNIVEGYKKIDEGKVKDGEKMIEDIFLKGEGDIAWN